MLRLDERQHLPAVATIVATAVTLALGFSSPARAQDPGAPEAPPAADRPREDAGELAGLSLEELLDVPVAVGSKTPTTMGETPGWVTVWTAEDIDRLGYDTLADLARLTPGFGTYTVFGERVLETRGRKEDSFNNNRHVLYVDGIPVGHGRAVKVPVDEDLPLWFARQVEFLRGPASALYGTSAFYGVLNVLPREREEPGTWVETVARYGTRDDELRLASSLLTRSERARSALDVGFFRKRASLAFVGEVDDPANLYRDDGSSVFVRVAHDLVSGPLDGLGGGTILLLRNGGLGEGFTETDFTHEFNDLTWVTVIPYLRYARPIGDEFRLASRFHYNLSVERGRYAPFSPAEFAGFEGTGPTFSLYESRVHDFEVLTELSWRPNDRRSFILGVDVDTRTETGELGDILADPGPPIVVQPVGGRFDVTILSVFGQYEERLPLLRGLTLTLGGHADRGFYQDEDYFRFSPRVAAVLRLTANVDAKLQYGTAFRTPGIKEIGLNLEEDRGPLRPESFRAFETGLAFHNDLLYASAVGFRDVTTDEIVARSAEGANFFENRPGETVAWGGEVELRLRPSRWFETRANYSYARATDPAGVELFDVPTHKANVILLHRLAEPLRLSSALVLRWIEGYRAGDGPDYPGHTVADLSFLAPVGGPFDAGFQVRNLFDDAYRLPRYGDPSVPLPRRSFLFRLQAGF